MTKLLRHSSFLPTHVTKSGTRSDRSCGSHIGMPRMGMMRKVNAVNPPVSRREEAGGARRAEGANHCARRHRARETLRGQFGQPSRDSGNPRNGIARDCSPAKAARTSATETACRVSARPAASGSTALRSTRPRARSELLRRCMASARPCDQILKSPPPIPASSTHAKHWTC